MVWSNVLVWVFFFVFFGRGLFSFVCTLVSVMFLGGSLVGYVMEIEAS